MTPAAIVHRNTLVRKTGHDTERASGHQNTITDLPLAVKWFGFGSVFKLQAAVCYITHTHTHTREINSCYSNFETRLRILFR
jgi:hypothetical protein